MTHWNFLIKIFFTKRRALTLQLCQNLADIQVLDIVSCTVDFVCLDLVTEVSDEISEFCKEFLSAHLDQKFSSRNGVYSTIYLKIKFFKIVSEFRYK